MGRQGLVVALIAVGVTTTAFADPPADKPARKPAARTVDDSAREGHPSGVQQQTALKAMQGALRRASRDNVRKQRHEELQLRLKGREMSAPIRLELRNHARRMSRLQRIRLLAVTTDPTLLVRIDGLIARETARHERHMTVLIARATAAPPARPEDHEPDDEVEE